MSRLKSISCCAWLAFFVSAGCILLANANVAAEVTTEHRDNVSFSITEQCLFQGTGTTSKTFSGTALNGQEIGGSSATNKFVDEDGAETNVHEFNVSCNVYTGYTVKAYATNLEHQLDFDPGNPDLILFVNDKPVSETSDSYDYLIANNDTQGYWTASVSGDDTSNTFSTNATNPTTIKLGNTITAEDGDTFSVAYKAYVGKLTPPGSYNGEAVYILASNPTPDIPEETVFQYEIVYNANGGTGLNVTSQSGTAQGSTTITPPTGLVGPEGEEFTGWSKTQGADDIDFPAGENITLTSSTFSSYPATLYAVYGNYMQNFTIAKCMAQPAGVPFVLTDKRDDKKYVIVHYNNNEGGTYATNECWMVQNLDLDLVVQNASGTTAAAGAGYDGGSGVTMGTMKGSSFVPFTSSNTDISVATWTIPSGSKGYTTQTSTGTAWNYYGTNASGSTNNSSTYEIRSYSAGDNCFTASSSWSSTDSNTACDSPTVAANTKHEGNMYNYPAATAGTILNTASSGTDASGSICPKGWRLPYGMKNNRTQSYYRLFNSFGSTGNFPASSSDGSGVNTYYYDAQNATRWAIETGTPPSGFAEVRPGYYYYSSGAINARGQYGYGWSSSVGSSGSGFYLTFYTSNVYPGTYVGSKGNGLQVRCVLRAS